MHISSNLIIKKNIQYFIDLKNKYQFDYIDSYMISGIIGYLNNNKDVFVDEKGDDDTEITIPKIVLVNRSLILENLWSIIYMLSHKSTENKDLEFYKKVFESNDTDISKNYLQIDRVKEFHEYAIAGVKILYNELVLKNAKEGLSIDDCLALLIEKIESDDSKELDNEFLDN